MKKKQIENFERNVMQIHPHLTAIDKNENSMGQIEIVSSNIKYPLSRQKSVLHS